MYRAYQYKKYTLFISIVLSLFVYVCLSMFVSQCT